jgi:hypothetical protein
MVVSRFVSWSSPAVPRRGIPRHECAGQAVGRFALELVYFYIRLLYNDFVPFITNRFIV